MVAPVADHLLKLLPRTAPELSQGFSAYHEPARPPNLRVNGRVDRLVLSGISRHQLAGLDTQELQGEIHELALDSLEDLMRIYGLTGQEETTLEITASPVAAILPESLLEGRQARVHFSLANEMQAERFRVTVRDSDPNSSEVPLIVSGAQIDWTNSSGHRVGQWTFGPASRTGVCCFPGCE